MVGSTKGAFYNPLLTQQDLGFLFLLSWWRCSNFRRFTVLPCIKTCIHNPEDALAFVRGDSSSLKSEEDRGLLEGLKEAWSDPKKTRDDKWLIDFFVNERYNEEEDDSVPRPYNSVVIDEESISDDEKTLEAMETFETKYRFRFEEPDEEFIKKYPRSIPDSMRVKDERRKLKRVEIKERKQKEKEVKRQEIERLKALKYKEIEAKIEKIKEASGNQDIDLGEKLFEEDFDDAHHDEAMSRMFGDDYYAVDDGNDEKPVFDEDEDVDVIKDYDHWLEKQDPSTFDGDGTEDWEEEEHGSFSVDDGTSERTQGRLTLQQEMIQASSKKSKRRKSKFANAIKKKKPVFDPKEKTFESYFDEYYQMDFEDIICGMPCRFKYRKVESNNFGLSTEEILSAQDRELNRWASLKKMLQYQRDQEIELKDHRMYQHRSSLPHVMQKILPSLFVHDPVEHHITEEEKKRLKNQKKKLRRQQKLLIANVEGNPDNNSPMMTPAADDNQNEDNASSLNLMPQHCGDKSSPKKGMKRKKDNEYSMQDAEENINNFKSPEAVGQPKKKKKKKHTKNDNVDVEMNPPGPGSSTTAKELLPTKNKKVKKDVMEVNNREKDYEASQKQGPKKNQKKKNKRQPTKLQKDATQDDPFFQGISDTRLAAYGENPKKIKNKVKYGKKEF
ncbi:Protein KRI1 [Chionoecetes opilio]|uniref:Protein KRI1 homolog n=1 Tax=Chionoecetes opilio TaxID=41210 RepID=A0A8J4YYS1_CHIOP|nr:Protein KRI1 [Chionoecetes opilio]